MRPRSSSAACARPAPLDVEGKGGLTAPTGGGRLPHDEPPDVDPGERGRTGDRHRLERGSPDRLVPDPSAGDPEGRHERTRHPAGGSFPRRWRRLARQRARPWNETSGPTAGSPPYQMSVLRSGVTCKP